MLKRKTTKKNDNFLLFSVIIFCVFTLYQFHRILQISFPQIPIHENLLSPMFFSLILLLLPLYLTIFVYLPSLLFIKVSFSLNVYLPKIIFPNVVNGFIVCSQPMLPYDYQKSMVMRC